MKKLKSFLIGAVLAAAVINLRAQSFQQDVANLYDDTIGSTNSTYATFAERKLTGDAWKAGGLWFFNASDIVAIGGGFAREWTPNNSTAPSSFNLSAGIQLSVAIAPLNVFGITNKFARPFAGSFVGTPFNGNNSGNLMNANRAGADVRFYQFNTLKNPVIISGGGYYGNETGTGVYAGNWAGAYLRVSWGAISDAPIPASKAATAWTTQAEQGL